MFGVVIFDFYYVIARFIELVRVGFTEGWFVLVVVDDFRVLGLWVEEMVSIDIGGDCGVVKKVWGEERCERLAFSVACFMVFISIRIIGDIGFVFCCF